MISNVSIDKRMLQVDQERAVEFGPSWASLMDNSTKAVEFTGVCFQVKKQHPVLESVLTTVDSRTL